MEAKPSDLSPPPEEAVDSGTLLREGLRCLQLAGAIFLRVDLTAPWAYQSPGPTEIAQLLRSDGRRVIVFHIFTEGTCRVSLGGGAHADVSAGDIVILPFADQHQFGDPDVARPTPIRSFLPPPPWATISVLQFGGGGRRTSMVCGYLYCDDLPFNPVLASLPPFMRVRPAGGPLARWVGASIEYALHASTQRAATDDPLLQRLPELLFMECMCEYARGLAPGEGGWLAALVDPVVGRALACLHRQPAHPWTLKELARSAGTSRSVLHERFQTLLRRAPMAYLTAWRLQLASRQLRTSNATLSEIAEATGYGSEASLCRAFKRQVGMPPGQWRQTVGAV